MNNKQNTAKLQLIISMVIFGTIGIFRKYIPLPSSVIALVRGLVGALFLIVVALLSKTKISGQAFKKNALYLFFSGAFIGFNWILLFEAYNNTSVAVATLCYYMAPVIVILLSPIVVKEKLDTKKWLCIITALVGMIFVSGVLNNSIKDVSEIKGVLFALGAATLYAFVILLNKKIKDISSNDKTIYQLGIAAITLLPYTMFTEKISVGDFGVKTLLLLLLVGVLHTGITYYMYFGSLGALPAQTAALYSYIDPIVAIILSALLLKEQFGLFEFIGTLLVLGSTIVCDIPLNTSKNKQ